MKRFLVLSISVLTLLGVSNSALALTVVARQFDELVARADTIFKGTVVAKSSAWVGEGQNRHISTQVIFQVEETYKGTPATTQVIKIMGGTVGDVTMDIPDLPAFAAGQSAVLFVVGNGTQFCPLVGIHQGRFQVVKDDLAGTERVLTNEGVPVVDTAELGKLDAAGHPLVERHAKSGERGMAAVDFKTQILNKLATLPR